MHLENQFLVQNGIYIDINNDMWVKSSKCFSPCHVMCTQEQDISPHHKYVCSLYGNMPKRMTRACLKNHAVLAINGWKASCADTGDCTQTKPRIYLCAMCANPVSLDRFFTQYKEVCTKFSNKSPLYIWNCDECPRCTKRRRCHRSCWEKAQTQVLSEWKDISTVLNLQMLLEMSFPLIIYNGQRVKDTWMAGTPPDIMLKASLRGI